MSYTTTHPDNGPVMIAICCVILVLVEGRTLMIVPGWTVYWGWVTALSCPVELHGCMGIGCCMVVDAMVGLDMTVDTDVCGWMLAAVDTLTRTCCIGA